MKTGQTHSIQMHLQFSDDNGENWKKVKKIGYIYSDDLSGKILSSSNFFPWISCDPISGIVSIIFYSNRKDFIGEPINHDVYIIHSHDGGESWTDDENNLPINDVSFTSPESINGYITDYIGIDSYCGRTTPIWTDYRDLDSIRTYVDPNELNYTNTSITITGSNPERSYGYSHIETEGFTLQPSPSPSHKTCLIAKDKIELKPETYISYGSDFKAFAFGNCNILASDNSGSLKNEKLIENTVKTSEDEIFILPNPNNGVFDIAQVNLDRIDANTSATVQIYNSIGKLVYSKDITKWQNKLHVDISFCNSGVYFLILKSTNYNVKKKIVFR